MNNPYPTPPPLISSPSIHPYPQAVPAQRLLQRSREQQQQRQHRQQNTTHESHPNPYQSLSHNGIPSPEQNAAVISLQAVANPAIFAGLRSFGSDLHGEQASYPNHPSTQQCQGVFALRECPDERSHGSIPSSPKSHDSSVLRNGRAAANSVAQSPSFVSNAAIRNTPSSPFDQGSHNYTRDGSVGLPIFSAASSNKHDRWCFVCEDPPRRFKTLDGLKRHLREHYRWYYCIRQELPVDTGDGLRCADCGIRNPDVRHLNSHNIPECVDKTFTRKGDLIKHLEKQHDIHEGSMLADQSEYSVHQKYVACGFCVFRCGSLNDLANHVDTAHYRFSQHVRDWDYDNIIRGLLSQPVVSECWQRLLAANPHVQEPWLRWNSTHAKQLKHRLEMSQEPEQILCIAAIHASNYGRSQDSHFESVPVTGLTDQDVSSPLSHNSDQSFTSHYPQTAAVAPSQHLAMDWNPSQQFSQIASETYEPPGGANNYHADRYVRPCYPQVSGENFMGHQHRAYLSETPSVSGTSQGSEGQPWTYTT